MQVQVTLRRLKEVVGIEVHTSIGDYLFQEVNEPSEDDLLMVAQAKQVAQVWANNYATLAVMANEPRITVEQRDHYVVRTNYATLPDFISYNKVEEFALEVVRTKVANSIADANHKFMVWQKVVELLEDGKYEIA